MGREARAMAQIEEWEGEGKLMLEMDELSFRGARRLDIHLPAISGMSIDRGWLIIQHSGGVARFDLGPDYAEKWRHAIENPKTLIDKLDVKSGSRVLIAGPVDVAFRESVQQRAGSFDQPETAHGDYDIIFLYVTDAPEIASITQLRPMMRPTGGIWVLHPKGRSDTSHDAIMAIAKPLGLVDVKSARFSDTHAALKVMVPKALRK